jgi:hypothetical protein
MIDYDPTITRAPRRVSPILRIGWTIGGLFLLAGGPISGYFLGNMVLEARRSATWPVVPGVVQDAHVEDRSALNHGAFYAVLAYTYRVGSNDFAGSRIRASDGELPTAESASSELVGLSVGTPVTVYYDPVAPESSVLKPGARWQEYALLMVPVVMFCLGLLALYGAFHRRKSYTIRTADHLR